MKEEIVDPAEKFARALVSENEELLKDIKRPGIMKEDLLCKVDNYMDFPKIFPEDEFIKLAKNLLLDNNVMPYNFFGILEKYMDLYFNGVNSYFQIKNAFLIRLRNRVKNYSLNNKKDILIQIASLESTPKPYSKTSFITKAMEIIDEEKRYLCENYPELSNKIICMGFVWEDQNTKNTKEDEFSCKIDSPLSQEEQTKICYHIKALRDSYYDLEDILICSSQNTQDKEAEVECPKEYFNDETLEVAL